MVTVNWAGSGELMLRLVDDMGGYPLAACRAFIWGNAGSPSLYIDRWRDHSVALKLVWQVFMA